MSPGSVTATVGSVSRGGAVDGREHPRLLSMFTVCPKCALTLVVTAADLRVAQGYVRCGRCSSVFNALAQLTDERHAAEEAGEAEPAAPAPTEPAASAPIEPAPTEPSTPAHSPEASAQAEPEAALLPPVESAPAPDAPAESSPAAADAMAEDVIPDDALEFHPEKTDVTAVFVESTPDPHWTAATGSFKALIAAGEPAEGLSDSHTEVEIDADFLASMLHFEAAPAEPAPEDAPHSGATAKTQPASPQLPEPPRKAAGGAPSTGHAMSPARATSARVPARGAPRTRLPLEATAAAHARSAHHSAPALVDLAPDNGNLTAHDPDGAALASSRPYLWGGATACAVLVLLAQIAHHYRDALAATAPLNRPLSALYELLGMPLVPRWDLHAYDVRQLGASVDPGSAGIITVRASIKNAAQQPQPLPLLRVTLLDRFGNRTRLARCGAALVSARTPCRVLLLPAGSAWMRRWPSSIRAANAVGFEIDACLPAPAAACLRERRERALKAAVRIGPYVLPSRAVLAPMAGVTDRPFRIAVPQIRRGPCGLRDDHLRCAPVDYGQVAPSHEPRGRARAARGAARRRRPRGARARRARERRSWRADHRPEHGLPGEEGLRPVVRLGAPQR